MPAKGGTHGCAAHPSRLVPITIPQELHAYALPSRSISDRVSSIPECSIPPSGAGAARVRSLRNHTGWNTITYCLLFMPPRALNSALLNKLLVQRPYSSFTSSKLQHPSLAIPYQPRMPRRGSQ